jgi:hypothetical protein
MLGLKSFANARIVLPGIELIQKLKKGHYGVPFSFGIGSREIWATSLPLKGNEGGNPIPAANAIRPDSRSPGDVTAHRKAIRST